MALVPFDDRDGWIWWDGALVPWREREAARADAWAALCQRRVRRRTGLCRQHLPPARPHRSADQLRPHPGLRDPVHGGADRRRLQGDAGGEQPDRRLCAPDRLARLGDAGGFRAADEDPPRDRRLAVAQLFRRRPHDRHPARHGGVEASLAGHRADRRQGHRPLHDRHAVQAQGGGRGVRRCADAGLARTGGGGDRGQHLLRHGRRYPYADAGLLPGRHHAPIGDEHRQAASDEGGGAADRRLRDRPGERGVPGRHRRRGDAGARDRRPSTSRRRGSPRRC